MNNQHTKIVQSLMCIVMSLSITCVGGKAFGATSFESNGVLFDNVENLQGRMLSLRGVGTKSVLFFKAFVAGFYMDCFDESGDPLSDVPKHLEVEYFTHIPREKLVKFTIKSMRNNTTDEEFQKIEQRVQQLEDYFVDIKPKDRFAISYNPNFGTQFIYNGDVQGVIEGYDFAKALFAVWIGEYPFDEGLKNQILDLSDQSCLDPSTVVHTQKKQGKS